MSIMGKRFFKVQKRKWKEVMIEYGRNEGRKAEGGKKEAGD